MEVVLSVYISDHLLHLHDAAQPVGTDYDWPDTTFSVNNGGDVCIRLDRAAGRVVVVLSSYTFDPDEPGEDRPFALPELDPPYWQHWDHIERGVINLSGEIILCDSWHDSVTGTDMVPFGLCHLLIFFGGLGSGDYDSDNGADYLKLVIWPVAPDEPWAFEPVVLKQWQRPDGDDRSTVAQNARAGRSESELLASLASPDESEQLHALLALGALGTETAIQALQAFAASAKDHDDEAQQIATSALGLAGDAALDALHSLLLSPSASVRIRALQVFRDRGQISARWPNITACLRSPEPEVRQWAVSSFSELKQPADLSLLAPLMASGNSDQQHTALQALERWQSGSDGGPPRLLPVELLAQVRALDGSGEQVKARVVGWESLGEVAARVLGGERNKRSPPSG